jgi:hypothetical protein
VVLQKYKADGYLGCLQRFKTSPSMSETLSTATRRQSLFYHVFEIEEEVAFEYKPSLLELPYLPGFAVLVGILRQPFSKLGPSLVEPSSLIHKGRGRGIIPNTVFIKLHADTLALPSIILSDDTPATSNLLK